MLAEVTSVARSARRPRGFTLIELFVGVAILAIILGLGVPSLRDWMISQRVSSVATELSTDMRYARADAISSNIGAGVVFNASGRGCYTVFRGPASRSAACNCTLGPTLACPAPLVELKTVVMPATGDVTISTVSNAELYRAGGTVGDEGAGIEVLVSGGSNRRLKVTTSTGLHHPTVCKPAGATIPGFKPCP